MAVFATRQNHRPPRVLPYQLRGTVSSKLPRVSSMASTSQRSKGSDDVLSKMDIAIQFLTVAKNACSVTPAHIALAAACDLLVIIRVRSILFFGRNLPIRVYSGYHQQQTGLHWSRTVLRQCLSSPRPSVAREKIKRTQPAPTRGHRGVDNVS